jgi:hypothetical protein
MKPYSDTSSTVLPAYTTFVNLHCHHFLSPKHSTPDMNDAVPCRALRWVTWILWFTMESQLLRLAC